jgi:lipopolysaccharide biosynthesis protein
VSRIDTPSSQRHLAFYLPQFHPIPENDAWWGPGFTEWVNVAKARPRFAGHHQPHIPTELGFYDLRLPETRKAQADLARAHGIDGFVYYHYWFSGRRLLERPFNEVLNTGQPDFPFCLCWANESWTRAWDGRTKDVLVEQSYGDDREHAGWLVRAFSDPRYIRVDGKPLFLIYRASKLPDPRRTLAIIRDEARRVGVGEVQICHVESFPDEHGDPAMLGFDAAVEFAPDWGVLSPSMRSRAGNVLRRLPAAATRRPWQLYRYADVVQRMKAKAEVDYLRYPCVTPRWDNTPRKGRHGLALVDEDPAAYRDWVEWVSRRASRAQTQESLVFVNSWNEWGEGAHLEPCGKWGRAYLQAHLEGRARAEGVG